MLIRAIALSLALLIGIGAIIPLATQQTRGRSAQAPEAPQAQALQKIFEALVASISRTQEAQDVPCRPASVHCGCAASARTASMRPAKAPRRSVAVEGEVGDAETGRDPAVGDQALRRMEGSKAVAGRSPVSRGQFGGSQVGSAAISVVGPAIGEPSTCRTQKPSAAFRRRLFAAKLSTA